MASKQSNTWIKIGVKLGILPILLATLIFNPLPVFAEEKGPSSSLPDLASFVQTVMDGEAGRLRGVYVPGVLAMPVVQQPSGNPVFVSSSDNEITEFAMAAEVGNVGLLAHNYLAGTSFFDLELGQEVSLVHGDGHVEYFKISRIERYQALDPYSPYSEFRDLETGVTITAEELFRLVYRGERHVTFQTCIEANGNSSWGRIFVIAEPKKMDALRNLLSHP
jgi:hypothetical protein